MSEGWSRWVSGWVGGWVSGLKTRFVTLGLAGSVGEAAAGSGEGWVGQWVREGLLGRLTGWVRESLDQWVGACECDWPG